jgi:hypothetical protein
MNLQKLMEKQFLNLGEGGVGEGAKIWMAFFTASTIAL